MVGAEDPIARAVAEHHIRQAWAERVRHQRHRRDGQLLRQRRRLARRDADGGPAAGALPRPGDGLLPPRAHRGGTVPDPRPRRPRRVARTRVARTRVARTPVARTGRGTIRSRRPSCSCGPSPAGCRVSRCSASPARCADGPLDPQLLARSLGLLVRRHDALRTRAGHRCGTGAGGGARRRAAAGLRGPDRQRRPGGRGRAVDGRGRARADRPGPGADAARRRLPDRRGPAPALLQHPPRGLRRLVTVAAAGRRGADLPGAGDRRAVPAVAPGPGAAELVAAGLAGRDSAEARRQRAYWTERLAPPWPSLAERPGSRFGAAGRPR